MHSEHQYRFYFLLTKFWRDFLLLVPSYQKLNDTVWRRKRWQWDRGGNQAGRARRIFRSKQKHAAWISIPGASAGLMIASTLYLLNEGNSHNIPALRADMLINLKYYFGCFAIKSEYNFGV